MSTQGLADSSWLRLTTSGVNSCCPCRKVPWSHQMPKHLDLDSNIKSATGRCKLSKKIDFFFLKTEVQRINSSFFNQIYLCRPPQRRFITTPPTAAFPPCSVNVTCDSGSVFLHLPSRLHCVSCADVGERLLGDTRAFVLLTLQSKQQVINIPPHCFVPILRLHLIRLFLSLSRLGAIQPYWLLVIALCLSPTRVKQKGWTATVRLCPVVTHTRRAPGYDNTRGALKETSRTVEPCPFGAPLSSNWKQEALSR